jgi:hypothetical protein
MRAMKGCEKCAGGARRAGMLRRARWARKAQKKEKLAPVDMGNDATYATYGKDM